MHRTDRRLKRRPSWEGPDWRIIVLMLLFIIYVVMMDLAA